MDILLLIIFFGLPMITWLYHLKDRTYLIMDEDGTITIIESKDKFAYIKGMLYIGTERLPMSSILIKQSDNILYLK